MDIKKMKQEYPVLLDYMWQQGYGKTSIGGVQVRLKELFEQESNYVSYGDFYEKLLKRKGISKDDERSKYYRLSVRRIEAFDEYGHLPNRFAFTPTLQQKGSMSQLKGTFKTIIEHYKEVSVQAGKASSTIIMESNYTAAFFAYMQSKGIYTLTDVTEPLILSYFYDREKQLRGYTCQRSIIRVLRSSKGLLWQKECEYLCDIMPPLKNIRKNFAILSDDETAIIASTLENGNSNGSCPHLLQCGYRKIKKAQLKKEMFILVVQTKKQTNPSSCAYCKDRTKIRVKQRKSNRFRACLVLVRSYGNFVRCFTPRHPLLGNRKNMLHILSYPLLTQQAREFMLSVVWFMLG